MPKLTYIPNRVIDTDGISDGALIYVYQSGSTTPISIFADEALTQPLSNPYAVPAGSAVPNIYYGYSGTVRMRVLTTGGVVVQDDDPYFAPLSVVDIVSTSPNKGADFIPFQQNGAGAVVETVRTALRRIVFATQFGMSTAASPATNSAALKAAINAVATGGKVIVPEGTYSMSVTGGLSDAVTINKQLTLEINGVLVANGFAMQINPYYMFRVTANDVLFTGSGRLEGNGTINDANTGDETTHPGLVYVQGNNFIFELNVTNPPKVGIALIGAQNARVRNGDWYGGPSTYTVGNTAYFGILAVGGGGHIFEGLRALRGPSGQRFISFIFTGGTSSSNDCTTRNCFADVHEKLIYAYGSNHFVHDNRGRGDGRTDWIRFMSGDNNRAYRNQCSDANGGVSAYDGKNIEICDNVFTNCKQVGVYISRSSPAYVAGFSGLKITGNTLIGDSVATSTTNGVFVSLAGSNTSGIVILNNRVENFGTGTGNSLIYVEVASPFSLSNVLVINNQIGFTGFNGITMNRVIDSVVSNNKVVSASGFLGVEINSAQNRWINNTGKSLGFVGINGLASNSEGVGNRYTDSLLSGSVTLSAVVTHTVPHGGVAPNARIFLQTGNTTAGVMIVAKGWPVTAISGNDFTITSSNGTAFGGTENLFWTIVQ